MMVFLAMKKTMTQNTILLCMRSTRQQDSSEQQTRKKLPILYIYNFHLKQRTHSPKCNSIHKIILCMGSNSEFGKTLHLVTLWSYSAHGHTLHFVKLCIWSYSEFGHTVHVVTLSIQSNSACCHTLFFYPTLYLLTLWIQSRFALGQNLYFVTHCILSYFSVLFHNLCQPNLIIDIFC